MLIFHL